MNVIKFSCPECTQRIQVKETWIGRTINCPQCGGQLTVRAPAGKGAAPRQATPAAPASALESGKSSAPPPAPASTPDASPAALAPTPTPQPPDGPAAGQPVSAKRWTVDVGHLLAAVPILIGSAYFLAMCQFGESPQAVWKRLAAARTAFLQPQAKARHPDAEAPAPASTPSEANARPVAPVRETPPAPAASATVLPPTAPVPNATVAALPLATPDAAPPSTSLPAASSGSREGVSSELPPLPGLGIGVSAVPTAARRSGSSAPTASPTPSETPPAGPNYFGVPGR